VIWLNNVVVVANAPSSFFVVWVNYVKAKTKTPNAHRHGD